MPIVEFIRSRKYNESGPTPAVKSLPKWYKDADKYDPNNNSTYKNCVPFFEGMSSGYTFVLPCDVTFYIDNDEPNVKCEIPEFVTRRPEMAQFHHPEGYYKNHFAWFPEWGVSLPEGYSALYLNPINRFDLPFLNTSGIIDNDRVFRPGNMPFFLKQGYQGTLPAGTPYVHIIPIRREDWDSVYVDESVKEQHEDFKPGSKRKGNNTYRERIWERIRYS